VIKIKKLITSEIDINLFNIKNKLDQTYNNMLDIKKQLEIITKYINTHKCICKKCTCVIDINNKQMEEL
jgi:hypothetical protein